MTWEAEEIVSQQDLDFIDLSSTVLLTILTVLATFLSVVVAFSEDSGYGLSIVPALS